MSTDTRPVEIPEPNPLLLEQLTWPEIEMAITRGVVTALVPVGSVEQHGPHLPLMVDAEKGTALGLRVARLLGDALVAPTIRVGCSEHHMGFSGTISLRPETLEAVCHDYAVSLARHGFLNICFIPSHGGNFRPLADMLPRLRKAVKGVNSEAVVLAWTDLLGSIALGRFVVEEASGRGNQVGGHADIVESSEFMHLHPGLIRPRRVEAGRTMELDEAALDRIFTTGFRAVTPNGVLGDPRGMDGELGSRLLDAAARAIADAFE